MVKVSDIDTNLTQLQAILGVVHKAIKTARSLYEAPEQLDSLLNDLTDCEIIVRNVEGSLQNQEHTERIPELLRDRVYTKLKKAKDVLLELEVFTHIHFTDERSTGKIKRVAWALAKGKVEKLKKKLESICEDLRDVMGEYRTYARSIVHSRQL